MGVIKDKIESLKNRRKIAGLSYETQKLLEKLNNPKFEEQLKAINRLDEVSQKNGETY